MAPMTAAERQRRYREKLKQENPEKLEKLKKENAKRTKKKYKNINELPDDIKREKRKKWREQKQKLKERPKTVKIEKKEKHNEDHQENPLGDCPASIKEELSDSFESSPSIQCIEASEDAATATTGSSHFSAGYQCDQCREDIVGFRYCCVECANYDLCGACEAGGHHAAHYVLRVPSTKPHVEVQAVLENIRNILFQKEDDGRCELEAEVKVEPPEPAPEPDPLAPAGGEFQLQDQTPPLVESTFVPSVKRDDLELEDTELKLELTDDESQETSHSRLVPVATQPTVPPRREARLCDDMKVYNSGGGGFTVYTHSADTDTSHDAQPAPDPTPQLVPRCTQHVRNECFNKGMLKVQAVKKNIPSTAKRKSKAPSILRAKVKKSDLI